MLLTAFSAVLSNGKDDQGIYNLHRITFSAVLSDGKKNYTCTCIYVICTEFVRVLMVIFFCAIEKAQSKKDFFFALFLIIVIETQNSDSFETKNSITNILG